jgi:hypothetical protein
MNDDLNEDFGFVDNAGGVAAEAAGGACMVHASVTFALPAFPASLTLTGAAAIDGTDNLLPWSCRH